MAKTATFGVIHLGTSFGVGYALTGSVAIAGAITFVEPLVNTVVHYFFDKYWEGRVASRTHPLEPSRRRGSGSAGPLASPP